jgi:hypothetical protein
LGHPEYFSGGERLFAAIDGKEVEVGGISTSLVLRLTGVDRGDRSSGLEEPRMISGQGSLLLLLTLLPQTEP